MKTKNIVHVFALYYQIQRMNNLIKKKCIIFHVVLIFSVALFWLSYQENWSKSNANGMQDSSYASYSKKKGSSFENWVTCVTNWRHMQTNVSFIIKLWSLILYQIEGLYNMFWMLSTLNWVSVFITHETLITVTSLDRNYKKLN